MKYTIASICIALILLFFSRTDAGLRSGLSIKPAEKFILGLNKHRDYKIRIDNVGSSKVQIGTQTLGGGINIIDTIFPGQRKRIKVQVNTASIFKNLSNTEQGDLKLYVRGTTNLSMGYTTNLEERKRTGN